MQLFNLFEFLVEAVTGRAIFEMLSDVPVKKCPIVVQKPCFDQFASHRCAESFSLSSILARWIRDLAVPWEIFRMVDVSS